MRVGLPGAQDVAVEPVFVGALALSLVEKLVREKIACGRLPLLHHTGALTNEGDAILLDHSTLVAPHSATSIMIPKGREEVAGTRLLPEELRIGTRCAVAILLPDISTFSPLATWTGDEGAAISRQSRASFHGRTNVGDFLGRAIIIDNAFIIEIGQLSRATVVVLLQGAGRRPSCL